MRSRDLYNQYESFLKKLKDIVLETDALLIDEKSEFIAKNVNFFTKSYMISLCSHLEVYVKDIALWYAEEINQRLNSARIPYNFILWGVLKEKRKDNHLDFKNCSLPITEEDISEQISPSPEKTKKFFKRCLGIDFESNPEFKELQPGIENIVNKRNRIIHYNDDAGNISLKDITIYIDMFLEYMNVINLELEKDNI